MAARLMRTPFAVASPGVLRAPSNGCRPEEGDRASPDAPVRNRLELANNSLHEVVGAVDLAATLGVVDDAVAQSILALAVRIKRMLRALPR
jgi:hypothetical protein